MVKTSSMVLPLIHSEAEQTKKYTNQNLPMYPWRWSWATKRIDKKLKTLIRRHTNGRRGDSGATAKGLESSINDLTRIIDLNVEPHASPQEGDPTNPVPTLGSSMLKDPTFLGFSKWSITFSWYKRRPNPRGDACSPRKAFLDVCLSIIILSLSPLLESRAVLLYMDGEN